MKFSRAALAFAFTGLSLAAPLAAQAQQITGAGSTFGAPIYSKWVRLPRLPLALS